MTRWTDDELSTLKRMLLEQRPTREISDELGRTMQSVQSRARHLRDNGYARRVGGKITIWTEPMKAELADMWARNIPICDIAQKLGCSEISIATKASKMRLKRSLRLPLAAARRNHPIDVKYSVAHMHQMWSLPEDERRMAFYEKFQLGWADVLKRLAQ